MLFFFSFPLSCLFSSHLGKIRTEVEGHLISKHTTSSFPLFFTWYWDTQLKTNVGWLTLLLFYFFFHFLSLVYVFTLSEQKRSRGRRSEDSDMHWHNPLFFPSCLDQSAPWVSPTPRSRHQHWYSAGHLMLIKFRRCDHSPVSHLLRQSQSVFSLIFIV